MVTRYEVIKSEKDKRLYRGLVLHNGLKALLISDEDTDKAACALDVNVGSMHDPRQLPGLAHFCEHMLFMGTKKYPSENEYEKFLSQHGGSYNAYTSSENTNYHFDVSPQHLNKAVDRFAQFFLTPLFTETATDREVMAVNSEHEKNIANDCRRFHRMNHTLCDPEHDYHKFGTGNKVTLDETPKSKGIVVRNELLKFHTQWYSSDIMGLSILGKQSLDELETLVIDQFSRVEKKGIKKRVWETNPFRNPEDVQKYIYIVPIKDIRELHICFPIHDVQPFYRTGPGYFLGHLIGHEGKGSILSELKQRGWASTLNSGQKYGATGFGFFTVDLDLSEEGINHIDEIISLVFQYIRMLREIGIQKWIFEEINKLDTVQFRFKDKEQPQVI